MAFTWNLKFLNNITSLRHKGVLSPNRTVCSIAILDLNVLRIYLLAYNSPRMYVSIARSDTSIF